MTWEEIKSTVLAACADCITPLGYRFLKSRETFERSTKVERRRIGFLFVASLGHYKLQTWCGIRNNHIEEIFHRTSRVPTKCQSDYTTLNLEVDDYWLLDSPNDIAAAIQNAREFITATALPFLERDYSYQDYSNLLNDSPESRCTYHANRENRCHYGLIAAKLAFDPRFAELKEIYGEYLRSTNKGFYYPRFEMLVAELERQD